MKTSIIRRLALLTGCYCCAARTPASLPMAFTAPMPANPDLFRRAIHHPSKSWKPQCRQSLCFRTLAMGTRDEAPAKGRDRGHKGEQRRDIRVYVGDSASSLSEGAQVLFSEDQARYIREFPDETPMILMKIWMKLCVSFINASWCSSWCFFSPQQHASRNVLYVHGMYL